MPNTQTDTLTADFDASTKSSSNGNYGVETNTDNPSIPADEIQLGNNKGDNYTLPDADYSNNKWATDDILLLDRGTLVRDIDTTAAGKGHITATCAIDGTSGRGTVNSVLTLTNDFDVRLRLTTPESPTVINEQVRIYCYNDADNSIAIFRSLLAAGQTLQGFTEVAAVGLSDIVQPYTDDDFLIRLVRDSSDDLEVLYKSDETADITDDLGWTSLHTRSPGFSGDVQVLLAVLSGSTLGDTHTLNSDNFYIATGTFTTNWIRTSAYFVSRTKDTLSANQKVTDVVLNINCPNSSTTLANGVDDALEIWENDVDDFSSSTKNDGWTNAELLTAGMTEDGVDSTITLSGLSLGTKQYKWYKLYGVGDGDSTIKIYDVAVTYDAISIGHGMLLSSYRNRLVGVV